jgi:hypothetical protein
MMTASNSARVKPETASSTTFGWSETVHVDADRQVVREKLDFLLHGRAEFQQVRALLHADGQPDRRLAVETKQRRRRVFVTAGDGGDVAQAEEAVVDPEIDVAKAGF